MEETDKTKTRNGDYRHRGTASDTQTRRALTPEDFPKFAAGTEDFPKLNKLETSE